MYNCVDPVCMYISYNHIQLVSSCYYLDVVLVSGRIFTTDVERNKKKICGAINDLVVKEKFLSEESLVEIIIKQCCPVLSYGAGVWRIKCRIYA